jgi:Prokaryotic dksA/traR C4-type zinc finger
MHDQFIAIHTHRNDCQKLRQIEAALDRISRGQFGLCQECGTAITRQRLEVIPWAEYCVPSQEHLQEKANSEPEIELATAWRKAHEEPKIWLPLIQSSADGHDENTESQPRPLQADASVAEAPAAEKPSLRENLLMALNILTMAAAIGLPFWFLDLVRVR